MVKPLIVLALYCSVFYCMCCSFGFHLGMRIMSDALCVALLSFINMMEFVLLNVHLGKQCVLSV